MLFGPKDLLSFYTIYFVVHGESRLESGCVEPQTGESVPTCELGIF